LLTRLWNDFILNTFNKETKQGGKKKQTKVKPFYLGSAGKNIIAKHTDW
jgi:hypothetical protein